MKMSDLNPYREADRDPVRDQGAEQMLCCENAGMLGYWETNIQDW